MNILSAATQKQVEDSLVHDGVLSAEKLAALKSQAESSSMPLFSLLVDAGGVPNEVLTKTFAKINNLPYVNLSNVKIDSNVLGLLPQDIAEHYMAVPLGEMQHRLVVAMLDADNVQAVDFLSSKVNRPLKVYAASEEGIRQVLKQYKGNITSDVVGAISAIGEQVSKEIREGLPPETATRSKNKT